MIGLAWSISFILWAPAILFWQYIVGERTVLPNECYIQFLSEPIITFCTAIAAFYLPVTIMAFLFWKIYQETEKRAKDVQGLKGSGSGNNQTQTQRSGGLGSSAMLRQMSSQSCSSYELSQQAERNKENEGTGSRATCGKFCLQFCSVLRGGAARRTLSEAEQSSCDSLNNNDAGGSEEEDEGGDQARPPTGWRTLQGPFGGRGVFFQQIDIKSLFIFYTQTVGNPRGRRQPRTNRRRAQ